MDFVLKSSAWGLTELDPEDDNNLAALTGSNRLGGLKNGGFSIDLGLGRLGDLGDVTVDKLKESRGSTVASSPSRLSKRARAVNGTQKLSCLVDGCVSDLSNCREYHRRHRVCEHHSKTPVVMVGGREQRFCQQCSRFHCLGEFDEVKRSCRKRLDGHNRRRRKPQPESLYMSSQSFLSNHQGPRMLQFSDPQAYTTTTGSSNLTWPTTDKHHPQFHVIVQQSMCSNPSSGRNKQFPFLLANYPEKSNQEVPEVSISGQLLNTVASPENPKTSKSDKLTHLVESKRALSLLSTHPTQFNGLPRYSRSQGMEEKPMGEVLVADTINTNDHSNWTFEVGPDGLLENEVSQQVWFSWN